MLSHNNLTEHLLRNFRRKKLCIFTPPKTVQSVSRVSGPTRLSLCLSACCKEENRKLNSNFRFAAGNSVGRSERKSLLYVIWRFFPHKTNLQKVSNSYFSCWNNVIIEYSSDSNAGGEREALGAFVLLVRPHLISSVRSKFL